MLNDLDLELDGVTADMVIENRRAQRALITEKSVGVRMFLQLREMEFLAHRMGYSVDTDENYDESEDEPMY